MSLYRRCLSYCLVVVFLSAKRYRLVEMSVKGSLSYDFHMKAPVSISIPPRLLKSSSRRTRTFHPKVAMARNRVRKFHHDRAARQQARTVRNATAAGTLCGTARQGMTASQWRQYGPDELPRARDSNATASFIAPIGETTRRCPRSPRSQQTIERPSHEPLGYEPSSWTDEVDFDRSSVDRHLATGESDPVRYEPDRRRYGLDLPRVPAQGDRLQHVFRSDSSEPRVLWPPILHSIPAGWNDDDDLDEGEIRDPPTTIRRPFHRLPVRLRKRSPEEQVRPLRQAIDELERSLSEESVPEGTGAGRRGMLSMT